MNEFWEKIKMVSEVIREQKEAAEMKKQLDADLRQEDDLRLHEDEDRHQDVDRQGKEAEHRKALTPAGKVTNLLSL